MRVCSACGLEKTVHRCRKTGDLICASCRERRNYHARHPNARPRSSLAQRNGEIVIWYQAGWSPSELGYAFELSGSSIATIVEKASSLRTRREAARVRGGLDRCLNMERNTERNTQILTLHNSGKSLLAIAKMVGLSHESVRRILVAHNRRRSTAETVALRRTPKGEKEWSLRRYLREVVPREWYEIAYLWQPDNPSSYVLAAWLLGMDDSEIAALPNMRGIPGNLVHPALKHHGIKTRSQRESIQTAQQAGRMRGPKKSKS